MTAHEQNDFQMSRPTGYESNAQAASLPRDGQAEVRPKRTDGAGWRSE